MEIVDFQTSDIIPYENNPRINDKAVKGVMNSIRDFGFKSPIIVDANHVIICGHTRLKAAKKIGLETCPCIVAADLTPEQVKALRLADNKVAEKAEWDDESTSFKDPKTRRWRALKKVRTCFSKVIILTGTPRPNSLMDLWAQIYLLDGGDRLGKTITEYRNNYFIPDKQNGPIVYSYRIRNEEAEREVYDRIKDICISMKASDYLELPERLPPVEVPVVLDAKAWGVYKKMEKDCVLELQGKEITATAAAAVSNKLLQMANGAVYDDEKNVVEVHRAKLAALREIIDAASGPVLVFYNFRHDLARILEEFKEARELKNAEDIRAWNAGHIKMLLAHPASAGYGLNLQAGGHIIVWYGLTWSLEQYLQANARLDRQGQKEPVIIHHLIAKGTMDEAVMRALATKKKGQDAMMAAVGELVRGGCR